ncbi:MAG TPA: glycosyltransferase [Tepidisphaeraceae bacterium]|nr:glycosyltransferase [Tepidisphaeraceae bacterium]
MISIIICSITPEKFSRVSENYRRLLGDEPHEIIGIHDAKSLAEGYNRGVAQSKGDLLIFSHDDIEILAPDFRERLLGHMKECDVLGVAGTTRLVGGRWPAAGPPFLYGQIAQLNPYDNKTDILVFGTPARRIVGMKALDGVFLCTYRKVVEAIPFDQDNFSGFHLYDIDFTFRAHLAGLRVAVCCDLHILHESYGNLNREWSRYEQLFTLKHGIHLDPPVGHAFRISILKLRNRDRMLELMTPPHWGK